MQTKMKGSMILCLAVHVSNEALRRHVRNMTAMRMMGHDVDML